MEVFRVIDVSLIRRSERVEYGFSQLGISDAIRAGVQAQHCKRDLPRVAPNLAGLGEPKPSYTDYGKAVWFKKEWIAHRFNNGCYRLFVIGLVPGHVLPLVNLMFSPETLAPCSK